MSGLAFDRGRHARSPWQIPPKGWLDIGWRIYKELGHDNIGFVSAGVAFYALLALFPGLAAVVSIYGMLSDPSTVGDQLESVDRYLPSSARELIREQLTSVASTSDGALTVGVVLGVLVAIWSANRGTRALFTGLNIVYDETETRKIWVLHGTTLLVTLCSVIAFVGAIGLIAVVPVALELAGLGDMASLTVSVVRWPVLLCGVLLFLAVNYRLGPDRESPRWRWVTPGSVLAALLWLAASGLFALYVEHFNNYQKAYGSVGGVVVLLLWLWLTALLILLGAEVNAEIEHQTRVDSTVGEPAPMGERGAFVADTLGRRSGE